ncbi:hypothetical protein C8F04DRAFT_1191830 [Mycena alexandri]|uniref:Ribonuclease H1 N-terminal domain-containing protein n=1 Tax=Mycena alexandri TaxID=1745969 RepID=A0AAD6SGK8_9AGAR|nr:hypothetical protein C8F04DRAFT_1191830 [Mycena alexandri]
MNISALSQTAREYTDDEFDALIATLDDLHLATQQTRPRTPTPPALPPDYSPPVPTTPRRPTSRVYPLESPTCSGRTTESSHHGMVRGVPPHSSRQPGVFANWFGSEGAQVQVAGIPGAVHQGYARMAEAEAAFNYAAERSWVGVRDSRPPSERPQEAIPALPLPQDFAISLNNPLHGSSASAPKVS